jgi:hypothetical protein
MTDCDRSLQDEFDRHFRGDGPPPDTDDREAAAYQAVFAALHEEPEGNLSDDFAEQVADRVGLQPEPAIVWSDVLLLFLAVAALGATLVLMPSVQTIFQETVWVVVRSLDNLSAYVRLDVVAASGLALALTLGLDALFRRWRPLRRAPTPS